MLETYERKMEVIKARYAELGPKAIVSRLLGADVSMCAGDDETVTGETGGKLLLCYLFSVKDKEAWLSAGVKAWLEAQKPKYALLFPAQKACIEQAIIFLPKLERGLTAAAAARAPAPSFDTPDAARQRCDGGGVARSPVSYPQEADLATAATSAYLFGLE